MKRIWMALIMILTGLGFVGCNNIASYSKHKENNMGEKEIDYTISFDDRGVFAYEVDGHMQLYTLGIISSREELIKICNGSNILNSFNEEHSVYTDEFFKDNSLIIYSFDTGRYINTSIKNLVVNHETLCINIEKTEKTDGNFKTDGFYWSIHIVVKKQDIDEVKQLKINYL